MSESINNNETQQCNTCKKLLNKNKFLKPNSINDFFKTCDLCREKGKKKREKKAGELKLVIPIGNNVNKKCSDCQKILTVDKFSIKNSTKELFKTCDPCREMRKNRRRANPEDENTKRCTRCSKISNITEFMSDGNTYQTCNNCRTRNQTNDGNTQTCSRCRKIANITEFQSGDKLVKNCISCRNYDKSRKIESVTKKCSKCSQELPSGDFKNNDPNKKPHRKCISCRSKEVCSGCKELSILLRFELNGKSYKNCNNCRIKILQQVEDKKIKNTEIQTLQQIKDTKNQNISSDRHKFKVCRQCSKLANIEDFKSDKNTCEDCVKKNNDELSLITKACTCCKKEFDLTKFQSKNNKKTVCNTCENCRGKKSADYNKKKNKYDDYESNGISKRCTSCYVVYELENFKTEHSDELCNMCQICRKKARLIANKNKCPHGKLKARCRTCDGKHYCEHNKRKDTCRICSPNGFCIHGTRKNVCRKCDGVSFCKHGKEKYRCSYCGTTAICDHGHIKYTCVPCKGSMICEHDKVWTKCGNCNENLTCEHDNYKPTCSICSPINHLKHTIRSRVKSALESHKSKRSVEYLGCEIEFYREFIAKKFLPGMSWENHGEWHIDHIVPILYNNPTMEDVVKRLHYTNTQPLWAEENMSKSNNYISLNTGERFDSLEEFRSKYPNLIN